MHYLEIKHLRMIQSIARTNNLTKAAEKLFVSQSALSQQLKNVEEKIGANLFFRNGQKMVLTKIGKKILDSSHIILDEIEKTEREVAKEVSGEKGELKVGVRCIFCFNWIPSVVSRFQDKYPNVDLEIGKSHQPAKELMSKTFDITISSAVITNKKISHTPLFEDEFRFVMSGDHPLSKRKYLEIEDFEGAEMIEFAEKTDSSFYNFLLDNGIRLRRHMTVPHPETIVELVATGLGIALLPRWFVEPYRKTKKLHTCPFTAEKKTTPWKAHFLKGETIPSYQDEFIKTIISHSIVD